MSFTKYFCLTVFLERTTGITGVPFGRTDLSIGGIGTTFQALSHRHGFVDPGFQGMHEKCFFHVFFQKCFCDGFPGT